jgi:hypothetical protein
MSSNLQKNPHPNPSPLGEGQKNLPLNGIKPDTKENKKSFSPRERGWGEENQQPQRRQKV